MSTHNINTKVSDFFKIASRSTTIKKEIIGGILTFICMCYILPVNAMILSSMGIDSNGVFAITAIIGAFSTIMMALLANYPVVLSSGMGLNAFLSYTICNQIFSGPHSWQKSLIVLTISGIIFFIFSITPLRKKFLDSIPKQIKIIISASLGIFICFVGLNNSGLIVSNPDTLVKFGELVKITNLDNQIIINPTPLIALIGIFIIITLMFVKTKYKLLNTFAIPLTVVLLTIISIICAYSGLDIYGSINGNTYNNGLLNFKDPSIWLPSGIKNVVFYGFLVESDITFGELLIDVFSSPASYIAIFSLFMVNIFDTTSTLFSITREANLIDENGKIINLRRAMVADSLGCLLSGSLGTSSVTSLAESAVGVSYGAKTGLSSLTAGSLMLCCVFLYPIFHFFTAFSITAPVLFAVGLTIFINNLKELDKNDFIILITFTVSIIFTLLSYSLTKGIGVSLIIYSLLNIFSKNRKDVPVLVYIITILFLIDIILEEILHHLI